MSAPLSIPPLPPSPPLTGFVLALNASTYLLVAQPPLNAQPAPVYRDAFAASQICNLPASADSALFADAITCGETLVNVTSVEYASKGFLFLVINALFINEAVHVPSVMFDKRFFAREHGARAYSSLAWHLTWLIKLALTAAIKLILYTPCFYFLGQLRLDFTAYAAAAFATGGMSFAGSAVALLLAAVIPSLGAASTAFGCAVLLYQNVCGFFLPISAIPPYLIWLAWSSVFTYGYHAIMNSQQLGSAMTGGGSSIEERQVPRPPRPAGATRCHTRLGRRAVGKRPCRRTVLLLTRGGAHTTRFRVARTHSVRVHNAH